VGQVNQVHTLISIAIALPESSKWYLPFWNQINISNEILSAVCTTGSIVLTDFVTVNRFDEGHKTRFAHSSWDKVVNGVPKDRFWVSCCFCYTLMICQTFWRVNQFPFPFRTIPV
jgi:hypothetical protein